MTCRRSWFVDIWQALSMFGSETQPMLPIERQRREIASGAVHLPDWLSLEQQREIVEACRGWAAGPVPLRHTRLPTGNVMSVQTVCLGWHWSPYKYTRTAEEAGGVAVAPMPDWLAELGRSAVAAAYRAPDAGREYRPDTALINFYDDQARMGMHQDKDEKSDQPVVSLSLGDTAVFRFGNTTNRNRPYTDVELVSGDLFVFGGPSRFAYHGVPRILPGSADPACGLAAGRLNLTLRTTGLD
jgi:alkylated DNA repair protein (DNA oxidative demethylase)